MSKIEQTITTAAKMYEARQAVRTLFGDRYKEQIGKWIELLEGIAKDDGITVMQAAIKCAKAATDQYDGRTAVMVIAAATEHAEPTP
jgi:hypothetical protein